MYIRRLERSHRRVKTTSVIFGFSGQKRATANTRVFGKSRRGGVWLRIGFAVNRRFDTHTGTLDPLSHEREHIRANLGKEKFVIKSLLSIRGVDGSKPFESGDGERGLGSG
jgi:hypothetical protein